MSDAPGTLVVIAPRQLVRALRECGFREAARRNRYTITMEKPYALVDHAMLDGQTLGDEIVWSVER